MSTSDGGSVLTWDQLLALTAIRKCDYCGRDHAPVRTCKETIDAQSVPVGAERIYNNQLCGLDLMGRECEVCHGHVPMHRWADLDVDGFIVNCPYAGQEFEV